MTDHQTWPDRLERVPWGPVALFAPLAFGLAWLVALPLWLMDLESASAQLVFTVVAMAMMCTPAIAALVTMLATRTPRSERLRFLGMWPLRPAKRVVGMTLLALFAPLAFFALTTAVAALFGWVRLDLVHFSGFVEASTAALPEGVDPGIMPPPGLLIGVNLALFPILAVIPNSIVGFGEELGWRGWLLPALRPLGLWPSLLLSGAIWGLWHAPLTLLGHNYGLFDWRGVALMTLNCTILGVVFGWLRLRSGSVWPAVIGHGALNGTGGMILWLVAAGETETFNAALASVAGVAGWIVLAGIIAVLALTGQLRREPELAAVRPSA
ncbi:CPBP family intramembrane glutamic endopeptidase [Leucobacter chironomi]|uniref:CPBP family intramembrane glutamic endopeptidase n=1 Tax=Leucobacter chironomi TaxID=491918 RepID=UPI00040941BD|nr:CPBP family intramembrane glutamic endopeptidase [Leucobacter chironomi]